MTTVLRRAHGPTVRAIREARGRRSDELAHLADISTGYLSNIEAGRRRPEATITARLAAALDVPVEALTGQRPAIGIIRDILAIAPTTFARDIGLTPGRLHRIEAGVELPAPDTLQAIAVRLGVDIAALRPHLDLARTTFPAVAS